MTLSAPIYQLKSLAKKNARQSNIPLNQALDKIAEQEGFQSWSHLTAKTAQSINDIDSLFNYFNNGDLILLAARPQTGKTQLALKLLDIAIRKTQVKHYFFSLAYRADEVVSTYQKALSSAKTNSNPKLPEALTIDCSEGISADYICESLQSAAPGTVAVLDYLQLMGEKRSEPVIQDQIVRLKEFARQNKLILIFLCQIHRQHAQGMPSDQDVRLPNPLNLDLFNKKIFLGWDQDQQRQIKFEDYQFQW